MFVNEKEEYFKVEARDALFWQKMSGTKLKRMLD